MRDPQKFTTFVLGSFVFVYYLVLVTQAARVWNHIGHCPIPAFVEGGLGNALHAAIALAGPLPILAWSWNPPAFSALAIPSIDGWPSRMLGLLALCAGASLGFLSLVELGDAWRMGVEADAPSRLVDTGIYGSIRHPIYISVAIAFAGIFLLAPNLLFAAMLAGAIIGLRALARREEAFLASKLGSSYEDYRRRTRRFLL